MRTRTFPNDVGMNISHENFSAAEDITWPRKSYISGENILRPRTACALHF